LKNLFIFIGFCLLFIGKTFSFTSVIKKKDSITAEEIIRKTILHAKDNHLPDQGQPVYFKSHYKVNISPKLTDKNIDTSNVFFSERISHYKFKRNNELNEKIVNQRTLGFDQPLNEILATKIFSFNWFKSGFIFFNETYASPLSLENLNKYKYHLINSTSSAYVIHFSTKRSGNFLGGNLMINKDNYAVEKISIQHNEQIQILGTFQFKHKKSVDKWMPNDYFIQMNPGKGGKKFA
jgi:hypothetical protein